MKTRLLPLVLALFFADIAPVKAEPQNHTNTPIQLACEPAGYFGGKVVAMTALPNNRLAVFTRNTLEVVDTAEEGMQVVGRLNLSPALSNLHTDVTIQNDYVLVVERRGNGSFARLFNLSDATNPFEETHFIMPLKYEAREVVVDNRGWLYIHSLNRSGGYSLVHVYDLANVLRPLEVATVDLTGEKRTAASITYDPVRHMLYLIRGDWDWPLTYDVNDPRDPTRLWDSLTDSPWRYNFKDVEYVVGDWSEGRLYLISKFRERYTSDPIDMVVKAVDISDPRHLRIVKNTSGNDWQFKIKGPRDTWSSWPFPTFHVVGESLLAYQRSEYLIVDKQTGAGVSARLLEGLNLTGIETALDDGSVIFDREARLVRVSFGEPRKPEVLSKMVRLGGKVTAAVTRGGYTFLSTLTESEYFNRLVVLDHTASIPKIVWEDEVDSSMSMWLHNNLLIIQREQNGYEFWDIANPREPAKIQSGWTVSASAGVVFSDNLMVVGDSHIGLLGVMDLTDMSSDPTDYPKQVGRIDVQGLTSIVGGAHGIYAAVNGKLFTIDLTDPTKPTLKPWGPVDPELPIVELLGVQEGVVIVRTEKVDEDLFPTVGEIWNLQDKPDREFANWDHLIMKDETRLPLYMRRAQVLGSFLMLPVTPSGFEEISWELREDRWGYGQPYTLKTATCKGLGHDKAVLASNMLVELQGADGLTLLEIGRPGVEATIFLPFGAK